MIVESKEAIKVEKTTLDKKFHLISYGCQMNFADSEVVASILESIGYSNTNKIENSDLILLNTCSIREKAEQTIRKKLSSIDHLKKKNRTLKIGVLGCMAERLKEKFLIEEKIVDLVVGPDAYRDLPNLLKEVNSGNDAVNVLLSKDETYGDINPQRFNTNGIIPYYHDTISPLHHLSVSTPLLSSPLPLFVLLLLQPFLLLLLLLIIFLLLLPPPFSFFSLNEWNWRDLISRNCS